MAPLSLLPTEQQEGRKSIYNSNSSSQIDLKAGITGSLESLDGGRRVGKKEVGTGRNKAQPAAGEGGMCLLCFLLSAEAHTLPIANRRSECSCCTYRATLAFAPCVQCQANWVCCPLHPSNIPLHGWDPLQGCSGCDLVQDLLKELHYGLQFPEMMFQSVQNTPATSQTCLLLCLPGIK